MQQGLNLEEFLEYDIRRRIAGLGAPKICLIQFIISWSYQALASNFPRFTFKHSHHASSSSTGHFLARIPGYHGTSGFDLHPTSSTRFPSDDWPLPTERRQSSLYVVHFRNGLVGHKSNQMRTDTCSEKSCIDIPAQGICNIQTQQGFPICGCCEEEENVSCSSCGGDIGGGICNGTGLNGIAYQGCACTTDGGELPNPSNLCPENNGKPPPACTDTSCSPKSIPWQLDGLCTQRTPSFGPTYTHCACCPESPSPLACNSCGGNDGGKCKGVDAYYGFAYRGCSCTENGGNGFVCSSALTAFDVNNDIC